MIKGSCHCGTVTFEIAGDGPRLVSCNCSICRRLSTLWAHSPPATDITLDAPEGSTTAYLWGDKSLEFHSCNTCGCTTHWASVDGSRFAVNCRLADPEKIKDLTVKHFDGADTWKFLD